MTRHIIIFFACFLVAAVATTAVRAIRHDPHAGPVAALHGTDMTPEVVPAVDPHAGHNMPSQAMTPVNSVCAICGMPVDASLPTAMYQGKVIGFGCRACPPKFAKEPDRYGPSALLNRVVPRGRGVSP